MGRFWGRAGLLGVLGALGMLLTGAMTSYAQVPCGTPTYTGEAYAVGLTGVTVSGARVPDQRLGDTGPLPETGGTVSFAPATVSLAAPLAGSVVVLSETATGSGGVAAAHSGVASVTIGIAGMAGALIATLLTADTSASLSGAPTATTSVGSLALGPTTYAIAGTPNQVITIGPPGPVAVTVIANQQITDPGGRTATANALNITFGPALATVITGNIIISHARSSVAAAVACPPTPAPSATPTGSPRLPSTGHPGVGGGPGAPFWLLFLLIPAAGLLTSAAFVRKRRSSQ